MKAEEIARRYDALARYYRVSELVPELLGLRRLRHKLLESAKGDVLEAAVGTGMNLSHYRAGCRLTAVDISRRMLSLATARAGRLGLDLRFQIGDVERLPFADESFDTVVDTMSLCTYPDPVAALRELGRVCRRSGRVLLLEHGRSDRGWLGAFQDRRVVKHAARLGCVWNREPLALIKQAGLRILHAERHFFGVFHLIMAKRAAN